MQPMSRTKLIKLVVFLLLVMVAIVIALSLDFAALAEEQPLLHRKLSGGLEVDPYWGIGLSANGRYVVFTVRTTTLANEFYSVRTDGLAPPVRLIGPLPEDSSVQTYQITPDSRWVVYPFYQQSPLRSDLYSVPIGGGTAARLNRDSDRVDSIFVISPDSSRVVYLADDNADGRFDLYSVPVAGGQATKLNGTLGEGNVYDGAFAVSADSTRVIYVAFKDEKERWELFSVPITGGQATKLNGSLPPGGKVETFAVSPDSSRVVYAADQETLLQSELYSVPVTGGQAVKLNSALALSGDVTGFRISPDSSHVIYTANPGVGNVWRNLHSVPIAGGVAVQLNGASNGELVGEFAISPDSSRVVYAAEIPHTGDSGVFSTPIDGGSAAMLGQGDKNEDIVIAVSPDNARVVFRTVRYNAQPAELYSVPAAGGQLTRLNGQAPDDGSVDEFVVTTDGNHVVYKQYVRDGVLETLELFRAPLAGGEITLLNEPLVVGGNVRAFAVGPSGDRVLYVADKELNEKHELYVVLDSAAGGSFNFLPLIVSNHGP